MGLLVKPAGRTSWTDQLDGLARQTSLAGQLDGPAGQTSWTDQFFLFEALASSNIQRFFLSVCTLSQLPSPTNALFVCQGDAKSQFQKFFKS